MYGMQFFWVNFFGNFKNHKKTISFLIFQPMFFKFLGNVFYIIRKNFIYELYQLKKKL